MNSTGDPNFWAHYRQLPLAVRMAARKQYRLFVRDPFHSSLRFKELTPGTWSVRITRSYRAFGHRVAADRIVWFWIGGHGEYDRMNG